MSEGASWCRPVSWQDLDGQEAHAARIFFPTDGANLSQDDRRVLDDLVKSLVAAVLRDRCQVALRCEGWADPRQSDRHNQVLSQKRCDAVVTFLGQEFPGGVAYTISGTGQGKRTDAGDRAKWEEARRVDVFVRAQRQKAAAVKAPAATAPAASPPAAHPSVNEWAKRRAELFKRYSPSYGLWQRHGLDYLIDQYEENEERDMPVARIPRADLDKVLAFLEQVASPSDFARIRQWARYGVTEHVLAEAYCVEYRKAYDEAYRRSPGSLSR